MELTKQKGVRNALWLMGGNVVHKLIAFLVGIWTARYLGPANYGLISYASAYTTFFFSVATLGIHAVLVKQFVDDPDRSGQALGTTLVLQGCAALASMGMILLLTFVVDYGEALTILVVFFSSLSLLFQMLDSVKYWFQARLASKYAAIGATVAYLISSGYKVFLLATGKPVQWFALAASLDHLCAGGILLIAYRRLGGPRLQFSPALARKLLKASCPYIFSGLMVSVYAATDRLMLKQLVSQEAVGLYGTALSLANVWVFILAAIIDSMKPGILSAYQEAPGTFEKKNRQLYALIFYLSVAVALLVILFAEVGIGLLYGPAYRGAVPALRILAPYVAFSYLGVARDSWVICENRQKYLPWLYMGAAILNVGLNWLLIPFMGISGAALASLVTQICTVFVLPLIIKPLRPNGKLMWDAVCLRNIK